MSANLAGITWLSSLIVDRLLVLLPVRFSDIRRPVERYPRLACGLPSVIVQATGIAYHTGAFFRRS